MAKKYYEVKSYDMFNNKENRKQFETFDEARIYAKDESKKNNSTYFVKEVELKTYYSSGVKKK